MFVHFILSATSYTRKKRVALEEAVPALGACPDLSFLNKVEARNVYRIPTSFHCRVSPEKSVESLKEADPYFEDVYFCQSVDEFMDYLNSDLNVSSTLVGKYILSLADCSKSKLQKLVYLSYASYLVQTGKKLFTDPVYAFEYGPVCDDLYTATCLNGREMLRKTLIPDFDDKSSTVLECRLARTEDGLTKADVIRKVVERYKDFSSGKLADIIQHEGSPWHHSYCGKKDRTLIPDCCIRQFHSVETD